MGAGATMTTFPLPHHAREQPNKVQAGLPRSRRRKRVKAFCTYRWNPDDGENPRTDT